MLRPPPPPPPLILHLSPPPPPLSPHCSKFGLPSFILLFLAPPRNKNPKKGNHVRETAATYHPIVLFFGKCTTLGLAKFPFSSPNAHCAVCTFQFLFMGAASGGERKRRERKIAVPHFPLPPPPPLFLPYCSDPLSLPMVGLHIYSTPIPFPHAQGDLNFFAKYIF